jgi:hypothetical protein
MTPGDGPDRLTEVIAQLQREDDRFQVEGGGWTNNLSWVRGYDQVLIPMDRASSDFHARLLAPGVATDDPWYRNALFHLLTSQTSCYRYWARRRMDRVPRRTRPAHQRHRHPDHLAATGPASCRRSDDELVPGGTSPPGPVAPPGHRRRRTRWYRNRATPRGCDSLDAEQRRFRGEKEALEAIAQALNEQRSLILSKAKYGREAGENGVVINLANVVVVRVSTTDSGTTGQYL